MGTETAKRLACSHKRVFIVAGDYSDNHVECEDCEHAWSIEGFRKFARIEGAKLGLKGIFKR